MEVPQKDTPWTKAAELIFPAGAGISNRAILYG